LPRKASAEKITGPPAKKILKKFSYKKKIFARLFSSLPQPAGAGENGLCAKISLFPLKSGFLAVTGQKPIFSFLRLNNRA